ncbi:MAG: hypothetical protein OEX22_06600, partial [Cyclobacteriaceae bacterium]|nr:hypothetical protein [Cyclobacteriaceae bacterium]
ALNLSRLFQRLTPPLVLHQKKLFEDKYISIHFYCYIIKISTRGKRAIGYRDKDIIYASTRYINNKKVSVI